MKNCADHQSPQFAHTDPPSAGMLSWTREKRARLNVNKWLGQRLNVNKWLGQRLNGHRLGAVLAGSTSLEHRQGYFGNERDGVLHLASVDILYHVQVQ